MRHVFRGEPRTLSLAAERRSNGELVYEEVAVEAVDDRRFRVLATPGLLADLAAGDEFELLDEHVLHGFRVLKRAGNVGVQFFVEENAMVALEGFLAERLGALGGWLDGKHTKLLVWTVPVAVGFPAIEKVLYEAQRRFPGSEWMYGNVYDPIDGKTPLNWWLG